MQNKEVLRRVFDFYCKQQYVPGQFATFDRQQYEATVFTVGNWMHFCRDFQVKINTSKLLELFKRQAKNSKELNFDQFVQLLNILAGEEGTNCGQYLTSLGLDNWKACVQKMKTFQRPFQMQDQAERIKDIKYQFKIYHPEVKNDEQIKQILLQRKQQNEQLKLIERKKKAFYKLQFELKHFTKSQLLIKYPALKELIEKLPDPSKPKTFSIKEQDQSFNVSSQQRHTGLTWESLNQLPMVTDFLQDLMEEQEQEEDDLYLKEYQEQRLLNNSPLKIVKSNRYHSVQGYQNEKQKRSVSDHKQITQVPRYKQHSIERINDFEIQGKILKFKSTTNNPESNENNNFISLQQLNSNQIKQKLLRQQKQQLQHLNHSVELPRQLLSQEYNNPQVAKDKPTANKLNISMLKRVQQLSGLEAIKEQNLLNQIISQQREKTKIAQK
ncbi:unnamed protein product (macronuclear) [Paramecium tetraurelia]|uniref:Uncharacterized protein n=1 Tax=Paramecium tetraurelia TaxID=5888 RepID=A0BH20_PARTE|nr:uncharacterized protein GSPATT00028872001 [Paramecium tetraurelia]CAK57837.1 unnamed protein product [Paramecium tetraurelia]|eukprot:XP_001425235.1 hypothetical protein (macronuclear) [Paramecium tetraurelia strain d4-2]